MSKSFCASVLLTFVLTLVQPSRADDGSVISYTLTPILENEQLSFLAIEINFRGDEDGVTELALPNDWGGKSKLYDSVKNLKVSGGGASVEEPFPDKRVVRHEKGALLKVSYDIVQNWAGVPAVTSENEYRPIVQPNYFHVIGNAVFILPARDQTSAARFEIRRLPSGWQFASDLEHGAVTRELSLAHMLDSISVGGDFRVLRSGLLRVAIRGQWSFRDESFLQKLTPVMASHRKFWGDRERPFLVTVLPLQSKPGEHSLGGTGLSDAFAFFATDGAESAVLNRILAHEHLHSWIPRQIGRMPERDEARDYWLSEGFTDFYTTRLLLRDGIWTITDYVEDLNKTLASYATSKVRTAPNSRIVEAFWTDPETGQLPYQRGNLLAMLWDFKLSRLSRGKLDLDNVMLAMKARAAADRNALAVDLFEQESLRAGHDIRDERARFVERGEALLLPSDIAPACGTMNTLDVAEFDRGFDAEQTSANDGVVTGLRDDSPAHRAGLRNGMKIIKREAGKTGDSRVPITYRVNDNGVERLITYKPEGPNRNVLQEFVLKTPLAEGALRACVKEFSGL